MKIKAKFSMGIQPDRHVIGGTIVGFNVITVASVRTLPEAQEMARWIKTALKEKAGAHHNGLILPSDIADVSEPRRA